MSEESARLRIPYLAASQAQKHVTHNEALTLLDTLVQASVIDKDLTTPPISPAEGDCYIVARHRHRCLDRLGQPRRPLH